MAHREVGVQHEIAPGGCRVTETWTDRRNMLLRKQGNSDGFVRAEFTKDRYDRRSKD